MMERSDHHDELAAHVLEQAGNNPTLTVNLMASTLDATVDDVAFVIDSYEVVDGELIYRGPGRGGGWISEEIRAGLVKKREARQIGYRWPDGSLRDMSFDINNPEHRAEFDLPDPDEATQN